MNQVEMLRWVGPDMGEFFEQRDKLTIVVQYDARTIADNVADGVDPAGYILDWYRENLAELRRLDVLYERCYGVRAIGRWAGYLLRTEDSDVAQLVHGAELGRYSKVWGA